MRLWFFAALFAVALLFLSTDRTNADNPSDFYQAYEIVTGTDMRQRPWGMAQCLREVLVKVSGDPRLKDDPRVIDLAAHADRFVTAFDYVDMMAGIPKKDDQGSYDRPHKLTVHFDPAKIDGIRPKLGESPWHGERPAVVPVLLVHGPKPPAYVLSAEAPQGTEQRGAFVTAASEFGMKVRMPTDAELAAWGASADHFPYPKQPPPEVKPGESIVVGTLDWNEALPGWVGSWRTHWQGRDHAWQISGVNYDAAFRDIVRGVAMLASGRGAPD
ncbi:MAG: DUF2066 domain-containing protein [Alphaproteobacteria bacterium]|nr:DUF2066 domain-containing protein [Alphaproteobacteria bacterium]